MEKSIGALKGPGRIKGGRANPAILDRIRVEYYGVPTPINQIANITVPEARVIVIQPWDPGVMTNIEKAIQMSDIGINPINDGRVIRLVFPVLTEERRKELTKQVKKLGEETKVAVRTIRRDAIEEYRKQEKKSEITKDDLAVAEKDVQDLTDKYTAEVDKIVEAKIEEIMEV